MAMNIAPHPASIVPHKKLLEMSAASLVSTLGLIVEPFFEEDPSIDRSTYDWIMCELERRAMRRTVDDYYDPNSS